MLEGYPEGTTKEEAIMDHFGLSEVGMEAVLLSDIFLSVGMLDKGIRQGVMYGALRGTYSDDIREFPEAESVEDLL